MAHSQYFASQRITREPSSYYAFDGSSFNAFPSRLDQKGGPYAHPHNAPYMTHSVTQPRALSDTPLLNDLFSSPAFQVTRPVNRTASPAPAQPQHAPATSGPDQITRSSSLPEQSLPPSSAQNDQARSITPEPTPSAPLESLKKSNSAQAALSSESHNEGHISRQHSEHGSAPGSPPRPANTPLFPEPQHHLTPHHANTSPPNFHYNDALNNRNCSFIRISHSHSGGPPSQPLRRVPNSLMARDIRPDMASFEAMLHALQDFNACNEIFESMSKELDQ